MEAHQGKRYLVTGATGFLGSHLVALVRPQEFTYLSWLFKYELLTRGAVVRIYARSLESCSALRSAYPELEYCIGELHDTKQLREAMRQVDGVFHLAGVVAHTRNPEATREMMEINLRGTLNVVKAAGSFNSELKSRKKSKPMSKSSPTKSKKAPESESSSLPGGSTLSPLNQPLTKAPRVIYASTSGVVACSRTQSTPNDTAPYCEAITRDWPYYRIKIQAEKEGLALAAKLGVEFIMMRPSVMLGPGDDRFRSTHFLVSFLKRSIPVVPAGGYAFVDVRDAAAAFATAMIKGVPGRGYLLCADSPTISQFLDRLGALSGVPPPKLKLNPKATVYVASVLDTVQLAESILISVDPVRAEMGACFWGADSGNAKRDLDFEPRDTTDTLRDTISYIRSHYPGLPSQAKL